MNPEEPQASWPGAPSQPPTQYAETPQFGPQYAETPQYPGPQYPGPQYPPQYPGPRVPGRGPTQSALLRWGATALVVCLLLAGAVVLHRTVLSRLFGGAASPQEAVTRAIAAIEDGDLSRVGLLLPPDEVAGLSDIAKQAKRISSALDQKAAVSGSTKDTGIQVSVKNLTLKTEDEQRGLTKVSIENADITASFDPSKASGPVKKYFDTKELGARQTSITVRGAEITTDGDRQTVRLDGRKQSPFVMTVQRDGSWYVSPLFTLFQYISEQEGHGASPVASSAGFGSPVKAAEAYVSALAKSLNTRSITEFARATGGVEGRLLQTYRSLFDSTLDKLNRENFSIDVTKSQFGLLSVTGNTARVRPEKLHLTAMSYGESHSIDWDGSCLVTDDPGNHHRACLGDRSTVGPFTPLIERLNYLVAIRTDGGWKISASRTVFSMVADVLSWVGDAEMPIIKALTRTDPTELTKTAKVADTVRIGGTATVKVDAIGPYVDGGYAVVDIPNPSGRRFAVYCRTKHQENNECQVVTLVTPAGKAQQRYAGGRNGEAGDYKAIVVAETGEVDITVRSR